MPRRNVEERLQKTDASSDIDSGQLNEKASTEKKPLIKRVMSVLDVVFTSLLIIVIILLVVHLITGGSSSEGVRIFGIRGLVVSSGSMAPAIPAGSVVIIKETDPKDIEIEDVITFKPSPSADLVTHRVVDIVSSSGNGLEFITRGDANEGVNDLNPISESAVLGRVVFHIPFVGFVISMLGNIQVWIFVIVLFIAFFVAKQIYKLHWSETEKTRRVDKDIDKK